MWHGQKKREFEKGGFEDIPVQERCLNPEHQPPMHLYIPAGKRYRHVCPGCGKVTVMQPLNIHW
jgi:hypothetical protein